MNFTPLHDLVVIKRNDDAETSPGGIVIPDVSRKRPIEGIVVAVGPGTRNKSGITVPLDVKEGDKVLFSKHTGCDIIIHGQEYYMTKIEGVLGILS